MPRYHSCIAAVVLIWGLLGVSKPTAQAQDSSLTVQPIEQAAELIQDGRAEEARTILVPLSQDENPQLRVKALRLMGLSFLRERNTEEATGFLNRALTLSRTLFNRSEEARNLYYLARAATQNEDFEKAKMLAETATHIARISDDKALEYSLQNLLTWTYYMTGVSFYAILEQEAEVVRIANEVGSPLQKAAAYNNLGYDLTVAGTVPIDSTIDLMKFANNIYANNEGHNGRWYTLMNLTWQHRLKNDFDNSKRYGEMSLAQALSEKDRHAIVEAAFQLGETLLEMGRIDEAKSYYETGLRWRDNEKDRDRYVFDVYYARFLWETGDLDRAIDMLETAVDWLRESEVFYEMHGRALLASYYWELGKTDRAEVQLDIIENPRHNYISLEALCLAAVTRAKWFASNKDLKMAIALLESWKDHTMTIGVEQLSNNIMEALSTISNAK